MARASLVPVYAPDDVPVSVLVDYDGTISLVDVGDELLVRFVEDRATLAEKDRQYDEGRLGSRELMLWDLSVLPDDAELVRATATSLPQDETFARLVDVCRRHGAEVEIVSDGFGFHVEPNLARLGLDDVPIATNETRLEAPDRVMTFPYGHPACFVCGTCKRERVRIRQKTERVVVFVGDGTSDRFAAAHADVVFAKRALARICAAEGWPFHSWDTFDEIAAWVEQAFAEGRLPVTRDDIASWRARYAPTERPFICGPEVWGPGRTTPGPGPH